LAIFVHNNAHNIAMKYHLSCLPWLRDTDRISSIHVVLPKVAKASTMVSVTCCCCRHYCGHCQAKLRQRKYSFNVLTSSDTQRIVVLWLACSHISNQFGTYASPANSPSLGKMVQIPKWPSLWEFHLFISLTASKSIIGKGLYKLWMKHHYALV